MKKTKRVSTTYKKAKPGESLYDLLPELIEEWYMFGSNVPLAENTLARFKDRAIAKAGVKRIHIHDLRHSHASNLIADGVNIVQY